MLLSTLRALDALAELGAAEHEDWDRTGDTVPSSPCPDDDAAARALVQQAHAEYFRVVARIEAVRRKIDRADSKVQRLENGPHSKTRNSDMARYKQDIERYLLEIEAMRPELAAAIERWKKLKARCGLRSKQPRAFVGIEKAAGYEMQTPVVDEAARLRQQVEATRARRAQNYRQQIALMQEHIMDITGEIAALGAVPEPSHDVRACISMLEREKQECMERSTALTQLLAAITQ